ncbi:MAG TPA: ABC-type transport auxiliary lipoprotein family protein [Rudaea sp.]|nr:ABC-type transport auxiliary lipoprotein family protein [Rudaea sp.]
MIPESMRLGSMKLAATLIACAVALAGCSPPPVPDITYFRLPAPAALPHADKPLSLLPIEVEVFGAEGVYAEQSLIYTVAADGNALRTYHYQLWSDPPAHALQSRLVVMLRESGISGLVTDRLPASTQALRIHGTIRRYERSGNGGTYTVSVAIEMRVEQDSGEPLIEQDYHAEVLAADATLDATAKAFGSAVDKVFAAFYRDLVALEGETHAG